ncbi:MAG TPA: hypothetical protein VFV99_30470 [Kofleriaceae bacterium]|nr:hypothetical protein [Kofleriaceae bacterium]
MAVALPIALALPRESAAGEIPIITLGDSGPDQEIPTDRSFYIAGRAGSSVVSAQAVVVRRGSSSLFGDDGPDCHDVIADLRIETTTATAADDEEGEDEADDSSAMPRYDSGPHRAFEIFPNATGDSRRAPVLVSSAWQRGHDDERQFNMLVPYDRSFFSAGYGYCLFVVTSEHSQELDHATIVDLFDDVASKIVTCGDKASCDEDALGDYEARVTKALFATDSARVPGRVSELADRLREAARVELGSATGIVEAIDRMGDRWHDKTTVMTPTVTVVWAEVANDPFAHAVAALLARSGALLPQVRSQGASSSVALFTADGKLQVKAIQLLDDGRSIRVAASKAPSGAQARVLTATTDTLAIADGLTLYDLIQLGNRRIRVDKEWVSLKDLGERMANLGTASWSADDSAYLVTAGAHMKRLANFVDLTTTGATCTTKTFAVSEAEQSIDAIRQHLGEWLVCQKVDAAAIETMREQLEELTHEEDSWRATKDKLVARSQRIVTLTTTEPTGMRVSFASRTWFFSYVTPMIGWASVVQPDDSFGLFYFGAQIHLAPNPVDDPQWRDGITAKDLRRAIALEVGIAPYQSSFGPEMRYGGSGSLPPLFFGAAVHVLPYTSVTFGGSVLDKRSSTLLEEQPHTIFAPYIGLSLQLNLPDLVRDASHPTSDTTATR